MKERGPVTVLFLCRGSLDNGIGHVTRSRTVAKAMHNIGRVTLAAIGDDYVDNLLMGHGVDYTVLSRDDEVMPFVKSIAPDVVIFDLTFIDPVQFASIASGRLTVSLSPVFNCIAEVDMLFHRTDAVDPGWEFAPDRPVVRKGLDYAVVSDHCHCIEESVYWQSIKSDNLSIAVTMGGTDASNKTFRVLETIKEMTDPLLIWALLGEGYSHSYEKLVDRIKGSRHEVILAKTTHSMWRILNTCSLAIVAGGTTTYEAAYVGLPSLNMLDSPRQRFLIRELVDRGVCTCLGDTFDESLAELNPTLTRLNRYREELFAMHLHSRGLIDGRAAARIADEILLTYYRRIYGESADGVGC